MSIQKPYTRKSTLLSLGYVMYYAVILYFLINIFSLLYVLGIIDTNDHSSLLFAFFTNYIVGGSSNVTDPHWHYVFFLYSVGISGYYILWPWIRIQQTKRRYAKQVVQSDDKFPKIQNIIKHLTNKVNIPLPKLIIANDKEEPRTIGFLRSDTYIMIPETMMERDIEEIEAVIAHEISHIVNEDFPSTIMVIIGKEYLVKMLLVGLVASLVGSSIIYHYSAEIGLEYNSGKFLWLFDILFFNLAFFMGFLIMVKISMYLLASSIRKKELLADKGAVQMINQHEYLLSFMKGYSKELTKSHRKSLFNSSFYPSWEKRIQHIEDNWKHWGENNIHLWLNRYPGLFFKKAVLLIAKNCNNNEKMFIDQLTGLVKNESSNAKGVNCCKAGVLLYKQYPSYAKESFLIALENIRHESSHIVQETTRKPNSSRWKIELEIIKKLEAYCLKSLGDICIQLKQYDEAILYLNKTLEIVKKLDYHMEENIVRRMIDTIPS